MNLLTCMNVHTTAFDIRVVVHWEIVLNIGRRSQKDLF